MDDKLILLENWKPPKDWITIKTFDAHTGGEPLRIFVSGYPDYTGKTILEKRRYAKENLDHIRTALMWEPRGHADMYGCIIIPPISEEADFGVIFLHNEGYSSMCGHGIIAITKVVLETGLVKMTSPMTKVTIDTPSGLVTSYGLVENDKVISVRFQNVPSYVDSFDNEINIPELGRIKYDLAFGGAYYAFVDIEQVGLRCTHDYYSQLIDTGMKIKHGIMKSKSIKHPFEEDLGFLYGTIFIDKPHSDNSDSRNVCIFADGEVDRSPTGTGVSARMAIHYFKNEIGIGEPYKIESIIGSTFTGRVINEIDFGNYKAVIPEVEGHANITGKSEFFIDPEDTFKYGFILR